MMHMEFNETYITKYNKCLRYGYTTGSCAAAAAKAAAFMLLSREEIKEIILETPKGIVLRLEVKDIKREEEQVTCAIQKDSGDDPDVTNGLLIYAKVSKQKESQIVIDGGKGVGRVTKRGLEQPIGTAAINRVPRAMIEKEVQLLCEQYEYTQGLKVEIIVPEGEEVAKSTFNGRLGILGGISILGTSGIVEPMSEQALIDSIRVEMKVRLENGNGYLLIAPGNYGIQYIKDQLPVSLEQAIKCSNFIGETIDMAVACSAKGILFVSHIGKFIKVAGGIMNTHSRSSDSRMEILAAHSLRQNVSNKGILQILEGVTTEDGLTYIKEEGKLGPVMESIMERIHYYLELRAYKKLTIGAIVFSNELGELGRTQQVNQLLHHYEEINV